MPSPEPTTSMAAPRVVERRRGLHVAELDAVAVDARRRTPPPPCSGSSQPARSKPTQYVVAAAAAAAASSSADATPAIRAGRRPGHGSSGLLTAEG